MRTRTGGELIRWAAAQPWCDGQVVLFGTSYYGMVQPQVARLRPPALKGFFSIEMCTDFFRHIAMFGGAPQPNFFALWVGTNFTPFQFALRVPPLVRALASHVTNSALKRVWWPQLKKRMARVMKGFQRLTPATTTRAVRRPRAGRQDAGDVLLAGRPFRRAGGNYGAVRGGAESGLPQPAPVRRLRPARECRHAARPETADHRAAGLRAARLSLATGGARLLRPSRPRCRQRLRRPGAGAILGAGDRCVSRGIRLAASRQHRGPSLPNSERRGRRHAPARPRTTAGRVQPTGGGAARHRRVRRLRHGGQPEARLRDVGRGGDRADRAADAEPLLQLQQDRFPCGGPNRPGLDERHLADPLDGAIRPACRRIDAARSTATEIVIDIDGPEPLVPGVPVTLRFSLAPQPVVLKPGEKLVLDIASRTDLLRSDASQGHAQFDMQVPPYYSRNTLHYGPDTYLEMARPGPGVPSRGADPVPTSAGHHG